MLLTSLIVLLMSQVMLILEELLHLQIIIIIASIVLLIHLFVLVEVPPASPVVKCRAEGLLEGLVHDGGGFLGGKVEGVEVAEGLLHGENDFPALFGETRVRGQVVVAQLGVELGRDERVDVHHGVVV